MNKEVKQTLEKRPSRNLRVLLEMLKSVQTRPVEQTPNLQVDYITVANVVKVNPITLDDGSARLQFPSELNNKHKSQLKLDKYFQFQMQIKVQNGKNVFAFQKIAEASPSDLFQHMHNIMDLQQFDNEKLQQPEVDEAYDELEYQVGQLPAMFEWIKSHPQFTKMQFRKGFKHLSEQQISSCLEIMECNYYIYKQGDLFQIQICSSKIDEQLVARQLFIIYRGFQNHLDFNSLKSKMLSTSAFEISFLQNDRRILINLSFFFLLSIPGPLQFLDKFQKTCTGGYVLFGCRLSNQVYLSRCFKQADNCPECIQF